MLLCDWVHYCHFIGAGFIQEANSLATTDCFVISYEEGTCTYFATSEDCGVDTTLKYEDEDCEDPKTIN